MALPNGEVDRRKAGQKSFWKYLNVLVCLVYKHLQISSSQMRSTVFNSLDISELFHVFHLSEKKPSLLNSKAILIGLAYS